MFAFHRIRKTDVLAEPGNQDENVGSPARERDAGNQSRQSSDKKKRLKKIAVSDSESEDDSPLTSLRTETQSTGRGDQSDGEAGSQVHSESEAGTQSDGEARSQVHTESEAGTQSAKKKRRLKKMVSSDSDSDDDTPLGNLASRSQFENKGDNQSEHENQSGDEAKASQESQSLSLRFLSSSDESDADDGKSNDKQQQISNKRSRSPANSDLEGGGQMKKKQRLYDSDDEGEQKSAAPEKEGNGTMAFTFKKV